VGTRLKVIERARPEHVKRAAFPLRKCPWLTVAERVEGTTYAESGLLHDMGVDLRGLYEIMSQQSCTVRKVLEKVLAPGFRKS
jgi:hypothetical protein